MLYDENLKEVILDTLSDRVSGITDCIRALYEAGYLPNKNKNTILNWATILIHAYQNIEVLTNEQQAKIDNIYNKVMTL